MAARTKTRGREAQGFYAKALGEAERRELPEARQMEGLDEEIAVMRVRLQRALKERRLMNFFVEPTRGHDDYLVSLALLVEAASALGGRPRTARGRTREA